MKAVRVLEYGGPLVLGDVPTPAIAGDEILVTVKSTAVNHLDLVEASGTAREILPIDLPWIPGPYLISIGASRVIDYRAVSFETVLREKVDVVFDLVGGDTQKRSFLCWKRG